MFIAIMEDQKRCSVDSYKPLNGGTGTEFHIHSQSFSFNKTFRIDNLPTDYVDQLQAFHASGPLVIEDTKNERRTVEDYRPYGTDKTQLYFTSTGLDGNRVKTVDLPVEAVDLLNANQKWNINHPNYQKPVDLSSDEAVDALRESFFKGELYHGNQTVGLPLNLSEDGINAILEQADTIDRIAEEKRKTVFGNVLKTLGLQNVFKLSSSQDNAQPESNGLTRPVLIEDLYTSKARSNDNTQPAAALRAG